MPQQNQKEEKPLRPFRIFFRRIVPLWHLSTVHRHEEQTHQSCKLKRTSYQIVFKDMVKPGNSCGLPRHHIFWAGDSYFSRGGLAKTKKTETRTVVATLPRCKTGRRLGSDRYLPRKDAPQSRKSAEKKRSEIAPPLAAILLPPV